MDPMVINRTGPTYVRRNAPKKEAIWGGWVGDGVARNVRSWWDGACHY